MQWPQELKDQLEQIAAIQPLNLKADKGRLNALSGSLARLDHELREKIQAATVTQVPPLIDKLQADGRFRPQTSSSFGSG
jgi:hypothetical protein